MGTKLFLDYNYFLAIVNSLKKNDERKDPAFLLAISDDFFVFFKDFIALNIIQLNIIRKALRSSEKDKKRFEDVTYETVRNNWINTLNDFSNIDDFYLKDKSIKALSDLLSNTFIRKSSTIIPQPPINFLDKRINVDDSDIDWIYNRLKENSSKYFQSYSVSRIIHLSKIDLPHK